ncbi:hypothetical protein LCGC14_0475490 [marine sediment metagenome]|uniref:Uncharacterized protein n=1 Tax=marine sediment metagenome TaxID=412755 RepID=A0A0F9UXV7_9ZZZZ
MKKVTIKLELCIIMSIDESIEISEVVNELDYCVKDTTKTANILETQLTDYEVVNSV